MSFEKRVCVVYCVSEGLFYAQPRECGALVSSALELFNSMCRCYRFKLVSGASIVNIAELFKIDDARWFGKRVGLEWLLCLSVCGSSMLLWRRRGCIVGGVGCCVLGGF